LAPPLARSTMIKALVTPMQSGRSKMAMIVLTHFGIASG
jgi:hypothetical protein